MQFCNQNFFVAGISKSGESSARFLLKRGAKVYIYDDFVSDNVMSVMQSLEQLGAVIVTADAYESAVRASDVLVLSPGIPIDNALPVMFRRLGKAIIGEEELGSLYLRATAVAVTGTNGKTTTVSMINDILKLAGKNSVMCGNIGTPLIGEVENLTFSDYAVIEVSSFQLETLSSLRPHVAIITNITEDHLNRHYNMENYVFLKSKLIRNLRESEFAILNYDDERVRRLAELTRAKVIYFSAERRTDGVYYADGDIYCSGERVFSVSDMQVEGMHNIYNALACIAAAYAMGIDLQVAAKAICEFKGIRHRIEKVYEKDGKTYINDSKGTNVDATLKAVACMNNDTVILLGGKDKGYDYTPLFEKLKESRIVHAVLYGENRIKLLNAAIKCGYTSLSMCSDFYTAVYIADRTAKSGQNVLLSPASSSFDSFSGYEERGDAFLKAVKAIG
ncbi:MAG: UDP-N-acetylmuramoyl-L-alanine--D-glutamate ligase [Clostridia bacterium]|nr:UDP-N-acetylmuramoyl-L-alanine--D-glutamate ligase [Clostridia bacterium]